MGAEGNSDGTVGKALDVLELVANAGRPVRLSELLAKSGYPKATLYRFLQTLTNQGMLIHDAESQAYSLGMRLVRLAHAAWSNSSLAPVARTTLDQLSQEIGETIHLAQLDQGQVLYIDKRNAARPVEMFSMAGKIAPAYCTGVGKAMLAFLSADALREALTRQSFHRYTPNTLNSQKTLLAELSRIRERGHAFDREEHEPGIICIAVPILLPAGQVVGGLSITSTKSRSSLVELMKMKPLLKNASRQIAADVESWRFPQTC